jgi:hypothetical protein
MQAPFRRLTLSTALCAVALTGAASAQTFTNNSAQIPHTGGYTESVNFSDVDHDGDFDAAVANGGDCCNQQNRLWVNNGGMQGGTLGFFTDVTTTQFPAVLDDSRDIEFVDIDNDGDEDLYVSNTSSNNNQSNRWWVNIAGPGSSIALSQKLVSGGFIDWSCFCAFGDLDNDGDMDVIVTNNNGPARLLANNIGDRNRWVGLRLVGGKPARDMLGARVGVFRDEGPPLWRRAHTDGSYASAHDPRVLVGLGAATTVRHVQVVWPSGRAEEWADIAVNQWRTLTEGPGRDAPKAR